MYPGHADAGKGTGAGGQELASIHRCGWFR